MPPAGGTASARDFACPREACALQSGRAPNKGRDATTKPADPQDLAYDDEPDAWAEAPGTVGEGEPPGVYGVDSCRLHNGIANGNYTRLTPYQVAVLAHRQGVACGANLVRAVAISGPVGHLPERRVQELLVERVQSGQGALRRLARRLLIAAREIPRSPIAS